MAKKNGFNVNSPMGRIFGSGFKKSVKTIDKTVYGKSGGYKMKRGEKLSWMEGGK
jgi:hypothetical protein